MKKINARIYGNHLATDRGIEIHDNPRYVTFTYYGIPLWCFDYQSGSPGLMSIIGALEDCWSYGSSRKMPEPLNHTVSLEREMRRSGLLGFYTDFEINIARSLYSHSVPLWPLRAKYSHGCYSGAFITNCTELRALSIQEPLVKMTICAGCVSAKTRKRVDALPKWFMEAVDGKQTLQKGLKLERLKSRPEDAYRQSTMILMADIDHNKHTNYKTYIRKCYEALQTALTIKEAAQLNTEQNAQKIDSDRYSEKAKASEASGHKQVLPRWLTSDIMRQGVKTLRVKFIKESQAGEEVSVHVWQEDGKPFWVFFTLERQTPPGSNQILFEMSLEFFELQPNL
ncbi:hypothetical protein ElyMa_001105300 [Elysia marginata]|uniref:Uncharacterized protein n=1 Tax=Elysia marginata TaxID=1093978 RepID=A0AAV4HZ09_9GAST|nr:hypothetical protein ElyMa_001105300 [Elysia marginata]